MWDLALALPVSWMGGTTCTCGTTRTVMLFTEVPTHTVKHPCISSARANPNGPDSLWVLHDRNQAACCSYLGGALSLGSACLIIPGVSHWEMMSVTFAGKMEINVKLMGLAHELKLKTSH